MLTINASNTVCKRVRTLFEGMVDVEVCEMIAVNVREPHLGFICLFLHLTRTHEALRDYTTVMGKGRRATRSRPFPLPLVILAQHSAYILHTTPDSAQRVRSLCTSSHHTCTTSVSVPHSHLILPAVELKPIVSRITNLTIIICDISVTAQASQ